MDISDISWEELYRRAVGRHVPRGTGYEDNFRSGRISRVIARRLFDWLRGAHPQQARALVQDLGWTAPPSRALARPAGAAWNSFLDRYATSQGVDVRYPSYQKVPPPPRPTRAGGESNDKVRRDFADKVGTATSPMFRIPLGEPFYFRVESIGGTVVSLSEHRHRWMPERFNDDGDALIFSAGVNIAPSRNGEPRPLIEFDDPGLHQFVFIVLKDYAPLQHLPPVALGDALPPQALDQLAESLSELSGPSLVVLRVHVLFHQGAVS